MKKLLSILSVLSVAASASVAATATISFTKGFEEPTALWTALENSGSVDYAKMLNDWCNTLVVNGGSYTENLYLVDRFEMKAPAGTTTQKMEAFKLSGSNTTLAVRSGATLNPYFWASDYSGDYSERGGRVELQNGATLINEGTMDLATFIMTSNGASTLVVKGNGILSGADRDRIGASSNTTAQTLRIEGSNASVTTTRLNFVGAEGTSASDVKGGKLEFVADANGLSSIKDNREVEAFSGVVEVDFTNLVWDEAWGDEHTFTLISSNNNSSPFATWLSSSSTLGKIIGATGEFSADAKNLFVTIAAIPVPEPSTYAMIFGAMALAFVAYRRRK